MSILVTPDTKVLIQGITGSFGARHAKLSLEYGTKVVAGVTPGKGGQLFEGIVPIFDTVEQAVRETGATVSAIFVPPPFAADAIVEAAKETGLSIPLVVRLEGNNVEAGKKTLAESGLKLESGENILDAAHKIVAAVKAVA